MLFSNIDFLDKKGLWQKNAFIETQGKTIQYIGKKAPQGYVGEQIDGTGKLAISGLFNSHCHVPMTLMRGYGEGLPFNIWLYERMMPFESKLRPQDIYYGSLLGMAEMLQFGVVSFTDMYMGIESIAQAADECKIKANISFGASADYENQEFEGSEANVSTDALIKYIQSRTHDRIVADASLHAEYTSNERMVRGVADYAKQNNLRVHVHASEELQEHNDCIKRHALSPIAYFEKCGLLDVHATIAHCVAVTSEDMDILKCKGATVAHCPSSNFKLGSGVAPIAEMYRRGIKVGIGTDGAASNNNLNELEEMNLTILAQQAKNHNPMCLLPANVLEMATVNGALSQGRTDCGAIAVGNRADITLLDMQKPHLQPVHDALANVLFSALGSDVYLTMVDGEVLYKNGSFLTIDIEKTIFMCNKLKGEILKQL